MLSEWLAWREREEDEVRGEREAAGGGKGIDEVNGDVDEDERRVVEEIVEEVLDEVEEIIV